MVNVWVLTLIMSMNSGSAITQTYEFKNREECVKAQAWYKNAFGSLVDKVACYPSLPTQK